MRRALATLAVAITAAAALAAAAGAHIIVRPNVLPGERSVTLFIRVPNERPTAATTKVDVKFPAGIPAVWYQPRAGWKATVLTRKTADGKSTEVDRMVFVAAQPGARIGPGQMVEFPLQVAIPGRPDGFVAEFRSVQTYSNGEVVRWIGDQGSATPASQVVVTGRDEQVKDVPGGVSAIKKSFSSYQEPLLGVAIAAVAFLLGRRKRGTRQA